MTRFQVFTRINLPLSKPIIVYTALTSFTWPWSGKRLDTVYNQLLLNPFFHVKMGAGIAMTFPEQFKG